MDGPKSQTRFLTMREELAATQAELARYPRGGDGVAEPGCADTAVRHPEPHP